MATLSIELDATYNESLGRRRVGDRYYAGIPCTGYQDTVVSLSPAQQASIGASPSGAYQAVLVAVDVGTGVVVGWVVGNVTTELAVNLLALVTPPAGATPYVRNTAAAGTPVVPVKLIAIY